MSDTLEPLPRPIEDDSVERITRFNEGAIQGLSAEVQDQYVSVQSEGIEPSYLLIYAEKEREDALKFHEALADHLAADGCDWKMRDWHAIPLGEQYAEIRRVWLQEARIVLLLLSARLVADLKKGVIALETKRPLLPLAFKEVAPDRLDGTPIAGRAIFADQGKAWISRSGAGRDAWVGNAAGEILALIQAHPPRRDSLDFLELPYLRRADDCDESHFRSQPSLGQLEPRRLALVRLARPSAGRQALDVLPDGCLPRRAGPDGHMTESPGAMNPSVDLETSVISDLAARPSRVKWTPGSSKPRWLLAQALCASSSPYCSPGALPGLLRGLTV